MREIAVRAALAALALTGALEFGCGGRAPAAAVPAGRFTMGAADALGDDDEKPPHAVDVVAFCLDVTKVTVAAYGACVRAGKCARIVGSNV